MNTELQMLWRDIVRELFGVWSAAPLG